MVIAFLILFSYFFACVMSCYVFTIDDDSCIRCPNVWYILCWLVMQIVLAKYMKVIVEFTLYFKKLL